MKYLKLDAAELAYHDLTTNLGYKVVFVPTKHNSDEVYNFSSSDDRRQLLNLKQ